MGQRARMAPEPRSWDADRPEGDHSGEVATIDLPRVAAWRSYARKRPLVEPATLTEILSTESEPQLCLWLWSVAEPDAIRPVTPPTTNKNTSREALAGDPGDLVAAPLGRVPALRWLDGIDELQPSCRSHRIYGAGSLTTRESRR